MSIKIKNGKFGYYVVSTVDGEAVPNEQTVLKMKYNQEGMKCPLQPYAVLFVTDVQGRELRFIGNKDNFLEKIGGDNKVWIEEVELAEDNGVWFFLVGEEVDQHIERKDWNSTNTWLGGQK